MPEASCHCGAVRIAIPRAPERVTDCNCSICRRYGTLWAYYKAREVEVLSGETDIYTWGVGDLEFHRCRTCGCVTHWAAADKTADRRMGVNARLLAPEVLAAARIEIYDGASLR